MSDTPVTIAPLATYRSQSPYPFCPGCGHAGVLDALNAAMVKLHLDPAKTVIVSDLGCVGLSDQGFEVNAFQGLHGRGIAYASGIKLARPDLEVIAVIGDGGCGIGGTHLLSAARRNVGITVLVLNNFGTTSGRSGVSSHEDGARAATPAASLERPLDLCGTVAVNGAAFAWRGTVFDKDLPERIAEAISCRGFALLDVWELCTAGVVPPAGLSRRSVFDRLERLHLKTGVRHREKRPEYSAAIREAAAEPRRGGDGRGVAPRYPPLLHGPWSVVLAGSAGGGVRSAARLAGVAAVLSGLRAAQRDDHSFTARAGHSVSELLLSPGPIDYAGVARPDALAVVTAEGLARCGRQLRAMNAGGRLFAPPELAAAATSAEKVVLDPGREGERIARGSSALAMIAAVLLTQGVLAREALEEAARHVAPEREQDLLRGIAAGAALAGR